MMRQYWLEQIFAIFSLMSPFSATNVSPLFLFLLTRWRSDAEHVRTVIVEPKSKEKIDWKFLFRGKREGKEEKNHQLKLFYRFETENGEQKRN